jgi:xanthine dehydrogenase YagR molybdenum-binding subunit
MGGGFGSKLWTSKYSVIAALFGRMTGRPVRMFLPRELTYLTMGNRPAANMKLKAGVKKDGTLTALEFEDLGTGGAFPSGGTALVDWLVRDNWLCPNVKTKTTDVFINAGLTRPFRAPGHPQCSWALEQMLDDLAEAIEMDPVELRLKNVPQVSQGRPGNPPYTSTGLAECIKQGAEVFEWSKSRAEAEAFNQENQDVKRGVGMAGAVWFVGGGGPPSTVVIKVFSDGSVNLNMGASDIGTGTKTIMAMVAAEELGVKPEVIQIENADTGATQYATPSGGSKTVPTEAPAVRSAALDAKRQILIWAAEDLDAEVEDLVYEGQWVRSKADPDNKVKVADISGLNKRGVAMGVGYRGPNPGNKSVNPFAAQFCEVEINVKTGQMNIRRFVGAHESGRVMDRLTFDCQIYGGITMGIGLAATEFRVLDQGQTGKLLNRNWHDYKLPTALDVPTNITPVAIDMPDPEANITGAKGLGEPVTIPTASAVANAVYHALGRRALESPINPISLTRLMSENDKEG